MAVKKGQYAEVKFDVAGTPVTIAKLREWSISISTEKIDSTAAGDDWTTHEVGQASWEGEATFVDADTFWFSKLFDKVQIDFYDDASDLNPKFSGTASFDVERSASYDDLIETSISFTGDGALTHNA